MLASASNDTNLISLFGIRIDERFDEDFMNYAERGPLEK